MSDVVDAFIIFVFERKKTSFIIKKKIAVQRHFVAALMANMM